MRRELEHDLEPESTPGSEVGAQRQESGSGSIRHFHSRKVRKPLMEKKRRARINSSLEQLKRLLLYDGHKVGSSSNKLDKADVLELAVRHLQLQRGHHDGHLLGGSPWGSPWASPWGWDSGSETEDSNSSAEDLIVAKQRLMSIGEGEGEASEDGEEDSVEHRGHELRPCDHCPSPRASARALTRAPIVLRLPSGETIAPRRLPTGDLAFVFPSSAPAPALTPTTPPYTLPRDQLGLGMWRPW